MCRTGACDSVGEWTGVRLVGACAARGQHARLVEVAPRVRLVARAARDRQRVASSALAAAARTSRMPTLDWIGLQCSGLQLGSIV